VVKCRL